MLQKNISQQERRKKMWDLGIYVYYVGMTLWITTLGVHLQDSDWLPMNYDALMHSNSEHLFPQKSNFRYLNVEPVSLMSRLIMRKLMED